MKAKYFLIISILTAVYFVALYLNNTIFFIDNSALKIFVELTMIPAFFAQIVFLIIATMRLFKTKDIQQAKFLWASVIVFAISLTFELNSGLF